MSTYGGFYSFCFIRGLSASERAFGRWSRRVLLLCILQNLFDCFILLRRMLALLLCSSRIQKGVFLRSLCWTYGKFLFGLSIDLVVSDMGDCACGRWSVSPSEPSFTWWTCRLVPWSWSSVSKHCVESLQSRITEGIFHGNGLTKNNWMCWNMPRRQDRQRISQKVLSPTIQVSIFLW